MEHATRYHWIGNRALEVGPIPNTVSIESIEAQRIILPNSPPNKEPWLGVILLPQHAIGGLEVKRACTSYVIAMYLSAMVPLGRMHVDSGGGGTILSRPVLDASNLVEKYLLFSF